MIRHLIPLVTALLIAQDPASMLLQSGDPPPHLPDGFFRGLPKTFQPQAWSLELARQRKESAELMKLTRSMQTQLSLIALQQQTMIARAMCAEPGPLIPSEHSSKLLIELLEKVSAQSGQLHKLALFEAQLDRKLETWEEKLHNCGLVQIVAMEPGDENVQPLEAPEATPPGTWGNFLSAPVEKPTAKRIIRHFNTSASSTCMAPKRFHRIFQDLSQRLTLLVEAAEVSATEDGEKKCLTRGLLNRTVKELKTFIRKVTLGRVGSSDDIVDYQTKTEGKPRRRF